MKTELPMLLEGKLLLLAKMMVQEVRDCEAELETMNNKMKATKKAFWENVHDEFKDLDMDKNHTLETDYINLGVVILEEREELTSDLPKEVKDHIDILMGRLGISK